MTYTIIVVIQKEIKTIDLFGPVEVSKGIVSLQSDKGTSYEMYIAVQDQLTSAYNELRNRKANEKWGKNFDELNEDEPLAKSEFIDSNFRIKNTRRKHNG